VSSSRSDSISAASPPTLGESTRLNRVESRPVGVRSARDAEPKLVRRAVVSAIRTRVSEVTRNKAARSQSVRGNVSCSPRAEGERNQQPCNTQSKGLRGWSELSGCLAYFDHQHHGGVRLSWQGCVQTYTCATAEHQRAQQSTELQIQTSVRSGGQTAMSLGQGKTYSTSFSWGQRCRTAAASHFQLHVSCWSWPTNCIGKAQETT
jgi:hypothetical protein